MKSKSIIATLVAAGLVAGGAAAWRGHLEGPYAVAHAAAMDTVGGVAAPAANPRSSSLPLNGFSQLVAQYGPAVVNITVGATAPASHSHSFNVTGTFDASGISGCTVAPEGTPAGTLTATPAKVALSFTTGAGAPKTNATSGSMSGSMSGTSGAKKSFTAPMSFEVAALLGIALVVSRRKA